MRDNELTIKFNGLSEAQVLGLKSFFQAWEYNINRGHSSYIGFMVDGDGDFKPKIVYETLKPVRPLSQELQKVSFKPIDYNISSIDKLIDYDPIACYIHNEDLKNKSQRG